MNRPSRWRIVYANGDLETINELVYLKASIGGEYLFVEEATSMRSIIRTIVMANVRSWEAIE